MDLDTLEREVRAGMSGPGYTAIAIDGRELLDLIARVRAAEAARDRLRAELDDVESNEITRALAEQVHVAESWER